MQTTSLPSLHLPPPFSGNLTRRTRLPTRTTRALKASVLAMRSDGKSEKWHDHKLVDDNMIVLKMRIQEMMIKERENRVTSPPDGWMEWEKEWYKNYDSDVYEFVGLLQILLMNNRPSLVVGVVALLMLSISTSLVVVLSSLLDIVM